MPASNYREKDRAEKQDPLIEKVVNQQIAIGDTNQARSDDQWNQYKTLFQPLEERMVDDANNWDSDERKSRMAAEAGADVTKSYQGALDQNQRGMERMGINPNSGRFQAIQNETNLGLAKDTAGAMNAARRGVEQQGLALRTGAAQFGRNMPNTGLAADSTALNGGSNAVGNINHGNAAHAAGLGSAAQWFNGAQSGNNSAGGLMNSLYGNQLQAWNTHNQNNMAGLGGLGSLASSAIGPLMTAAAPAMMAALRKGGVIKNNAAYGLSSLPYVKRSASVKSKFSGELKRKGYAEGG